MCIARFFIAMYFAIFGLYINELYPSKARGLGTSIILAFGTVASTTNPLILETFKRFKIDPMILFTSTAVVCGLLLINLK